MPSIDLCLPGHIISYLRGNALGASVLGLITGGLYPGWGNLPYVASIRGDLGLRPRGLRPGAYVQGFCSMRLRSEGLMSDGFGPIIGVSVCEIRQVFKR